MKGSFAVLVVSVGLMSLWSPPTQACSPIEASDPQWFATVAPAGGVWWVDGLSAGDAVLLRGLDGVDDVTVDVVSRGVSSIALAVPRVPAGSRYTADSIIIDPQDIDEVLEVGDTPLVATDDDVPAVALRVERREVRQGYADVAVSPFGNDCEQAPGWWSHTYGEGAFAVIDGVPDGLVLDMTVRPRGEEAFALVTSANQIVFDGDRLVDVDEMLLPPPGTDTEFTVHARYRRMVDGAVGPVVSSDVVLDPAQTERTEFIGCASAPVAPAGLALLLLMRRRRRR